MKSVTLDQDRYGPICRPNLYNSILVDILLKKVRHEKCDPRISMNSRIDLLICFGCQNYGLIPHVKPSTLVPQLKNT